jgi:hypothetical protein
VRDIKKWRGKDRKSERHQELVRERGSVAGIELFKRGKVGKRKIV